MPSQAIIVGGGIGAGSPFVVNHGLVVSNVDPPLVETGAFGKDPATEAVWVLGQLEALSAAQAADQRAVVLGRSILNIATWGVGYTNGAVIIGFQAGAVGAGNVLQDGIAIGRAARTDGNAVVIGPSVVIDCNAGTDRPVIINCTGVTAVGVSSLVAIGDSALIACQTGVVLAGRVDTIGGGGVCIIGRCESGAGVCIGGGGAGASTNGLRCVSVGVGTRAGGPLFGTAYDECVAIGQNANATGAGATGIRFAIAIGSNASATTTTTTAAAVAIGAGAVAANDECRIGSDASPMNVVLASGRTLRLDEAGADPVMGVGTLDAAGTVTIPTTAVTATSRIFVTCTAAATLPLFVAAIVAATSFTITSPGGVADAGVTFNWVILKPV